MATQTFNCPNCGAPLDYDGSPETTIHCPFCNTSVVVPEALRPGNQTKAVNITRSDGSKLKIFLVVGIALIVLITGCVIFTLVGIARTASDNANKAIHGVEDTIAAPNLMASATPVSLPSPTPAYANPRVTFGENGIGPGQLNDSRYLAVDGNGTLYVADYEGGRVQAFDSTGKYLSQFTVGGSDPLIQGLAANHQGQVFIAISESPDILQFDGKTGQSMGKLTSPNGGEFGALFAMANGNLAATWYEGRWGIITSLVGHRDDLVVYDSQGKINLTIPSFISGQTGDVALDNDIAVDGLGKIFALSNGVVYAFSPEGKYLNKFGSSGDQPGQFTSPSAIGVDGQDRIYIGDSLVVHVYMADGRFIADFPSKYSARSIAIDENGRVWLLGGGKITQYAINK